ncbi:MAG: hypothetical protein NUV57_05910 [archaeon]|nr:hypothetical protein [archaeon]
MKQPPKRIKLHEKNTNERRPEISENIRKQIADNLGETFWAFRPEEITPIVDAIVVKYPHLDARGIEKEAYEEIKAIILKRTGNEKKINSPESLIKKITQNKSWGLPE